MKQHITVHGRDVTFFPREIDRNHVTIEAPSRKAAVALARAIELARNNKVIDDRTPLAAALAAWAWWGTGTLDATGTWEGNYRPLMLRMMHMSGGTPLIDTDADWYNRIHQRMLDDRATADAMKSTATMLGSFGTWTQSSSCPWNGPKPGGDSNRATHAHYRALARAEHNTTSYKIRVQHCPEFHEIVAFGTNLGRCAGDRWGEEYRCWEHLPIVQTVTGCRFNELPVLRASNFEAAGDEPASVAIDWQYRDGAHEPGSPNLAPTKNKASRAAEIWRWAYEEHLVPVLADAAKRPGGLLFPIPPHLKTGKRQAQSLYQDAMVAHGYPYTSHWHRATYITRNVAPAPHGRGLSAVDVIPWVGHSTPKLIHERYWMPTHHDDDTSSRPQDWH